MPGKEKNNSGLLAGLALLTLVLIAAGGWWLNKTKSDSAIENTNVQSLQEAIPDQKAEKLLNSSTQTNESSSAWQNLDQEFTSYQ